MKAIAGWMARNGLTQVTQKTEAVMLTTKRGYETPAFMLNGTEIKPKEGLRYLGVNLCRKLGFRQHIRVVAAKASLTADAFGRILPNVSGARKKKRKLLAMVVTNQLLYVAPIWNGALEHKTTWLHLRVLGGRLP